MFINRIGKKTSTEITSTVNANANSGAWYYWSGNKYFTTATLLVAYVDSGQSYNFFAMFTGLVIPAGAEIIDARLAVYQTDTDVSTGIVSANDTNFPAVPTTYDLAEAKTPTTANVVFQLPGAVGWASSPNMANVIQELIDSGYTYSGTQKILILVKRSSSYSSVVTGALHSFESNNSLAPVLTIRYR